MIRLSPRMYSAICAGLLLVAGVVFLFFSWRDHLRLRPLRQHLYRGMEFARETRNLDAEREWKEALRLDEDYWPAWKMLAGCYSLTGRWREAHAAWAHVRRLAPGEPHVLCELATTCWVLGNEAEAHMLTEQELRQNRGCVQALSLAAQIADQVGDQKKAIDYLRRSVREQPDETNLLFRLAMSLLGAHRQGEAREVLRRLVKLAPLHSDAHGVLGLCYLDYAEFADHLKLAERHLEESLKLDPNNANTLLALGRLRIQQKRMEEARDLLERAAVLDPKRQRVYFELARVHDALGQHGHAETARQRFLKLKEESQREEKLAKLCALEPNQFDHHLELGLIKLRNGDLRRAEFYLSRARELKPDHPQVVSAWEMLERGRAGMLPADILAR